VLTSTPENLLVWILCATIAVLSILLSALVRILFGRIIKWSGELEDMKVAILAVKQTLDSQKNWGGDLEELKSTTLLILKTQEHHSEKVSYLDTEMERCRSRLHNFGDRLNEVFLFMELIRVSGKSCKEDCPVSKALGNFGKGRNS